MTADPDEGPAALGEDVRAVEYGDAGLLVELTQPDRDAAWSRSQQLGQALRDRQPSGLVDVVASIRDVYVAFDPLLTDHDAVRRVVAELLDEASAALPTPREVTVPVVYGGEAGPDLARVAEVTGLSEAEVVAAHHGEPWVVRFVGSPAGAPMLDGSAFSVPIPRLHDPRSRLAPGSVGLSGAQSIIYNAASPGGWQIIGRTPLRLFDLAADPPVPYRPGDRIRFEPVPEQEWDELERTWEPGDRR